jgi:hypothetical protein
MNGVMLRRRQLRLTRNLVDYQWIQNQNIASSLVMLWVRRSTGSDREEHPQRECTPARDDK